MEKITYTYDNPYIPPQVFPPVVDQQTRTVLFGLMPPTDAVISTPMDRVIPAPPAPPTNMQPSLQPGHIGGPNPDSLGDRGRFSPNLNALQTGKFQPSNPNMALPDRQGPPGPQGFRDNKNRDSRNLNDNGHGRGRADMSPTSPNRDNNHDNGGRNSGGHGDGGHGGGQGPH